MMLPLKERIKITEALLSAAKEQQAQADAQAATVGEGTAGPQGFDQKRRAQIKVTCLEKKLARLQAAQSQKQEV